MFGIVILVGRNVANYVYVYSLRVNAVFEEQLKILPQMTWLKSCIEIRLFTSIPMPHKRDLPLLPIAGFDPANGLRVDDRYVIVAWGRDYEDVCPLRGSLEGGGTHRLYVSVDVQEIGS